MLRSEVSIWLKASLCPAAPSILEAFVWSSAQAFTVGRPQEVAMDLASGNFIAEVPPAAVPSLVRTVRCLVCGW